jgi:hypothetical protein
MFGEENFGDKILMQIQIILINFFFNFGQCLNTRKKNEKENPEQNKTSINRQPYSKEKSIRDANICQTRVKQPYQQYIMSALREVVVDWEDQEATK